MTLPESVLAVVKQAIADCEDAPEAIEFWPWVHSDAPGLADSIAIVEDVEGDDNEATQIQHAIVQAEIRVVDGGEFVCWVGWNHTHRIVAFWTDEVPGEGDES